MFRRIKSPKSFLALYTKLTKLFDRVLGYRKRGISIGRLAIVLVAFGLFSVTLATIAGQLTSRTVIGSRGTVEAVGVGVYWDNNCTNAVTSIDWGMVEPGSTENVTSYIRNEGNSASTLSMYTLNWNPSNASEYMVLSWDYGGQSINPSEVMQVTFTLSVSASIEGVTSFSFEIVIVGSG